MKTVMSWWNELKDQCRINFDEALKELAKTKQELIDVKKNVC